MCVINAFSNYAWFIPLKDEKGIKIASAFHKVLNQSGCKPIKLWVDKSSEFYNRSVKSWLQDNNVEMYSTLNEGKSVVAERFIRTLQNLTEYDLNIKKSLY